VSTSKVKIAKERKGLMVNHAEPMLTTSEVARILNVHINTVRRWSNLKILKAYRIGSRGDRRFNPEDIDSFLAKSGKGPVVQV
jgi:excisionase family DNA binding protein